MRGLVLVLAQVPVPVPPEVIPAVLSGLYALWVALKNVEGPVHSTDVSFPAQLVTDLTWFFNTTVPIAKPVTSLFDWITGKGDPPLAEELRERVQELRAQIAEKRAELTQEEPAAQQVVSPRAALGRTQIPALAGDVARLGVWQEAHSGLVHRRIAQEWPPHLAAFQAALAEAVGVSADLTDAVDVVVNGVIPKEVDRVLGMLDRVAERLDAKDEALSDRIREATTDLRERIQGVRELLTDVVLPDVLDRIRAEREARRQADHVLDRDVAQGDHVLGQSIAGVDTRVVAIEAALAGSLGLARDKVLGTEPFFDLLLRNMGSWITLLMVPGWAALAGELFGRVAGQSDVLVGAIDDAARAIVGGR